MLDDGRLTDGQGRTVDFKNVLIVMTSNMGSEILAQQSENEEPGAIREQVMQVVRNKLQPEFINRIDEMLLFHRLSRSNMEEIVDIQLVALRKLLADRKITLQLDSSAREWLARMGFDPVYGARPLRRVIQNELQNPLASALLAGQINDGGIVRVSAGEGGIIINDGIANAA